MTSHIKRRQSGFTLAELMTTVTIIGILCAFAYPSYRSSFSRDAAPKRRQR